MISAEKIYVELLELYHNSGREFYAEMAALLGQQTEGMEHSFLTLEDDRWKLVASTVKNRDEREFLRKQADAMEAVSPKDFFWFSEQRSGEDSPCYTSPGTKKVHNGDLDRGVQDQRTHPGTGNLKNCPADCPALSAFQSRAELVSGSRHRTPGAALFRSDPGKTNGRRASDQCLCFPD